MAKIQRSVRTVLQRYSKEMETCRGGAKHIAVLLVFFDGGCLHTEYMSFQGREKQEFIFLGKAGETRLLLPNIQSVTEVARTGGPYWYSCPKSNTTMRGIKLHSGLWYGVGEEHTVPELLEWVWTHYVAVHKKGVE